MNYLVVATNRNKSIQEFLKQWGFENWDSIVVVEDSPEKSFDISVDHHYSWREIDEELGDYSWIISRQDSAIKSFGFYMAWKLGASNIFVLDDDCYPTDRFTGISSFVNRHINALYDSSKWTFLVPDQRTRGLPYKNMGTLENVMLNIGLWEGSPDFDSIQLLSGVEWTDRKFDNRILPSGQFVPICGMNLCFRSEITPLMYFPLMGRGQIFRRFDDIWCGIIVKKICDHLNYQISCGNPVIYHSRHSDPIENFKKETPGIIENETFWQEIDKIPLTSNTPVDCMLEIGESLQYHDKEYLQKLGKAINIWSSLFNKE
jgi:reversibly glycosylated polypeptide/UDP-arabinopyranose mutase